MISAKMRYEMQKTELLAIVDVFKNWRYYLKDCKYEVLVLNNHNNLYWFIDIKSLSSHEAR